MKEIPHQLDIERQRQGYTEKLRIKKNPCAARLPSANSKLFSKQFSLALSLKVVTSIFFILFLAFMT